MDSKAILSKTGNGKEPGGKRKRRRRQAKSKKKVLISAEIYNGITIALSHSCGVDHKEPERGWNISLAYETPLNLDKIVQRSIDKIYRRKLKAGDVDAALTKANAEKIWQGVLEGFKNPDSFNYGSPEQRLLIQMRYNVHVTAAFKNHHNVLDMTRALFDGNGKIKPWAEYKRDALRISKDYNVNWLEAEYVTAVGKARMASKWPEYERRGGSLEYRTQRDELVRDEHRLIDGAIYPVSHPFWDLNYPPNGWRCRCFTKWHKETITKPAEGEIPEPKQGFKTNPGKTGEVFTPDSPYFTIEGRFTQKANELFGYKPPIDLDKYKNNLSIFDALKEDKNYKLEFVDNMSGGFVLKHVKHPLNEVKVHLAPARMIAREKGDSVILQEIVQGQKNPDAMINGALWDFKEIKEGSNIVTAISNRFKSARAQNVESIVLILNKSYQGKELSKALYTGFYNDKNLKIKTVRIINDGKIIDLTREDYINGAIEFKIKNPGT